MFSLEIEIEAVTYKTMKQNYWIRTQPTALVLTVRLCSSGKNYKLLDYCIELYRE